MIILHVIIYFWYITKKFDCQCASVYLARKYYSCTCNNIEYTKSCLPPGREHNFTCSSEQHEGLVIGKAKPVSLYLKSLTPSLPEYLMEFCKATLTFESADEILWCDHSNESSLSVLSQDAICLSKWNVEIWSKFAFGHIWQWKG